LDALDGGSFAQADGFCGAVGCSGHVCQRVNVRWILQTERARRERTGSEAVMAKTEHFNAENIARQDNAGECRITCCLQVKPYGSLENHQCAPLPSAR
jgi:hypothetical protein